MTSTINSYPAKTQWVLIAPHLPTNMSGHRTVFKSKAAATRKLRKLEAQGKEELRLRNLLKGPGPMFTDIQLALRDLYIKEEPVCNN